MDGVPDCVPVFEDVFNWPKICAKFQGLPLVVKPAIVHFKNFKQ